MQALGYYNGQYGELSEMRVPMCDRASFFGDGVYDSAYARHGKIYAFSEHLERFYASAKTVGINVKIKRDDLHDLITELMKKLEDDRQFVYWQATRATNPRDHLYPVDAEANIWVVLQQKEMRDFRVPVNVITLPDTRYSYCNIKSINLLPNVLAANAAREKDSFEAVFHLNGIVTECAHSNVHILSRGALITAPADNHILSGITRKHLLNICRDKGIPVEERRYDLKELKSADEIIITSAGAMGLRVQKINGAKAGFRDGERLLSLQTALHEEFIKATE